MKTCLLLLFSLLMGRQSPVAFSMVLFANNSAEISARYRPALQATALSLKTSRKHCILSGYAAHSEGTRALRISKDRAQAILDYLVNAGVKREQLRVRFRGVAEPIGDNSTVNGRELNRRVQFQLQQ